MNANIEERIRPVVHTPENARVVALVNEVRRLAAGILIEASLGERTINHERIGTPEQRSRSTVAAALEIIEVARGLYPNQPVVATPPNVTFRTTV